MSYAGHQQQAAGEHPRCAVVTLSDTRTPENDTSGAMIRSVCDEANFQVVSYELIPDEPAVLRQTLAALLARPDVDAILTNGGTGITRRDKTIDVVESIIQTPLPGFGEIFRMLSFEQIGAGAMLSRAAGGVIGEKLIFAMPGSTKAVELAMTRLIAPELKHLLHQLRK
ncbi:MAG: MogA/MoaB family molybdenum cofactor biosynthesis protein [Tepidisphaeraceae bacterium]